MWDLFDIVLVGGYKLVCGGESIATRAFRELLKLLITRR